jgi:hypothetical protein
MVVVASSPGIAAFGVGSDDNGSNCCVSDGGRKKADGTLYRALVALRKQKADPIHSVSSFRKLQCVDRRHVPV